MADDVRFKDFTIAGPAPRFRIAPDDFECYEEIALDALVGIAETARVGLTTGDGATTEQRLEAMKEVLKGILTPESHRIFSDRMRVGSEEVPNPHPIGQRHIKDLLPWLMEQYGMRPTEESSTSADGSDADDTSSTDDVSSAESTLPVSP